MTAPNDLASLFANPPAGPSLNWRFRQGKILAWDPATLENTVAVGGSTLTDLPVLGVAETATLAVGDVVAVAVIGDEQSHTRTFCIVGQMVIPNTAAAFSALSFLSSRTFTASVAANQNTTSGSYGDLTTVGPTVPNVPIGPSSRCLVTISAGIQITINVPAGVQVNGGDMSFQILDAGGNEVMAPASIPAARIGLVTSATVGLTIDDFVSVSQQYVITSAQGLTPGLHTFRAKYRSDDATLGAIFGNRTITVVAL